MKIKNGKKRMEFDLDELRDNKCKLFKIGDKKGIVCMENGKITIYELNS